MLHSLFLHRRIKLLQLEVVEHKVQDVEVIVKGDVAIVHLISLKGFSFVKLRRGGGLVGKDQGTRSCKGIMWLRSRWSLDLIQSMGGFSGESLSTRTLNFDGIEDQGLLAHNGQYFRLLLLFFGMRIFLLLRILRGDTLLRSGLVAAFPFFLLSILREMRQEVGHGLSLEHSVHRLFR